MFNLNNLKTEQSFSKLALIIIVGFFLLSRFFVAEIYEAMGSDTYLYADRALMFRTAIQEHKTVYELSPITIEHPPLAVLWMAAPMILVHAPGTSETLVNPARVSWLSMFKFWYYLFDVFIFLILLYLFLKPTKFLKVQSSGLILYLIMGLLLLNFIYDRMDLWQGGLIFLAFILLLSRRSWRWSFFILALAINFKLIPILLVPLFILGSLPVLSGQYFSLKNFFHQKFVWPLIKRALFLLMIGVLIFLPFYLWGGLPTFDFFYYHLDRGLQLESFFSSLILVAAWFGLPAHVTHSFGSFNLASNVSDWLARFSGVAVVIFIIFIIYFFWRLLRKYFLSHTQTKASSPATNLAQLQPKIFLNLLIATLIGSMIFAKVLSPQYLLWVLPFFALLDFNFKKNAWAAILFVLACSLTNLIYPYLSPYFIHYQTLLASGVVVWGVPSVGAVAVLLIRNFLLIATAVMLLMAAPKMLIKND